MNLSIRSLFKLVSREARNTIQRPQRIIKLTSWRDLRGFITFQRVAIRGDKDWIEKENPGLADKAIESYEDYLELQASKLNYLDLEAHEKRFRSALRQRIEDLQFVTRGSTVLCLGARLGAEVAAFIDVGCFAVGIDLNPGENNRYVVYGDFQNLQLREGTTDIIYTNSIDHAFDLESLVTEVLRVIKPSGHIIVEPDPGVEEGDRVSPDIWQTVSWKHTDDLIEALISRGLKLVSRRPFEYPRGGQQLVFIPN